MEKNENRLSIKIQKEKIRTRYKGIRTDELEVTMAAPAESFYNDTREKRIAVYARVSTDTLSQTSSYELQKNYYTATIERHSGWKLVKIYADEGISGTSLKHRDAFIQMIADCTEGKIDLIVTQSVSRFSRNVLDCIGYVRKLKTLQPPVGVFFETENIYTLNPDSEMNLAFISTMAQEESHNKSNSMNTSIEMRFRSGIFLTPVLLGYDNDEEGNLVINEDEAKTVRLIFFMYLYGYTCHQIADLLTSLGRLTKKQNTQWSPGSVLQILQNERHCGDILSRKTWTPNYLDHKSQKNKLHRNQYRQTDHHEAIISRDDFIAVQHLISNAKYGNKGILPEVQVITEGALKGFVSINPRWSGFSANNYIRASRSVINTHINIAESTVEIKAKSGDFDLRGYEIARSQFFDTVRKTCVTLSINELKFSIECIRKMNNIAYVELLLHPDECLLAVRPIDKNKRNAIRWAALKETIFQPRIISGTAFLKTIYDIFAWKADCRYRVRGIRKTNADETLYVFNMKETEIFIPSEQIASDDESSGEISDYANIKPMIATQKTICAYPADWATTFGNDYYRHAQAQELVTFAQTGEWKISSEGHPFNESPLHVTDIEDIRTYIDRTIEEIRHK